MDTNMFFYNLIDASWNAEFVSEYYNKINNALGLVEENCAKTSFKYIQKNRGKNIFSKLEDF